MTERMRHASGTEVHFHGAGTVESPFTALGTTIRASAREAFRRATIQGEQKVLRANDVLVEIRPDGVAFPIGQPQENSDQVIGEVRAGIAPANAEEAEFTLSTGELELARRFYNKPELTALDFRETIVNALSYNGISEPTTDDIETGKEKLLAGMAEELGCSQEEVQVCLDAFEDATNEQLLEVMRTSDDPARCTAAGGLLTLRLDVSSEEIAEAEAEGLNLK